jgi:hypothetical protein
MLVAKRVQKEVQPLIGLVKVVELFGLVFFGGEFPEHFVVVGLDFEGFLISLFGNNIQRLKISKNHPPSARIPTARFWPHCRYPGFGRDSGGFSGGAGLFA